MPIPEYEDLEILNPHPFKINREELKEVQQFSVEAGSRVLIAEHNVLLKTVKKLNEASNFVEGTATNQTADRLLKAIDLHFRAKPQRIKKFKGLVDGDIVHYQKVKTRLEQEEILLLHELIEDVIERKYTNKEEIAQQFKEGKIDYQLMQSEFEKFDQLEQAVNNFRLPEVDRTFLKEHYYNPILLVKLPDQNLFRNIIREESELDFYRRLIWYAKNTKPNNLENYDWWYFSKLVESVDEIKIPYFNTERGEYANFNPDFIFWLKKDDKYFIKFIDPKGLILGQSNARDKLTGFEAIFRSGQAMTFKDKPLKIDLYFYNQEYAEPRLENYRRYYFEDIF